MKTNTKRLKRFLARRSIEFCLRLRSPYLTRAALALNEIQLSYEEAKIVMDVVMEKAPCDFLVFGLGNDSRLWSNINRGGNTVFVEDNEEWFQKVLSSDRQIKAYLVNYLTVRTQWQELLENPARLDMVLPPEIEQQKWDVILIDGPNGWSDAKPGRMKSIFHSSRLAAYSGDVFVHDCHREVEQAYSDRFLKPENLRVEVGWLRHYHLRNWYAGSGVTHQHL